MRIFPAVTLIPVLVAVGLLAGCASVQDGTLSGILESLDNPGALDESTVAAGLKEALEVGTRRAVTTVSKPDGYLGDPLLRIALPDPLLGMASTLRDVGLGAQVDELEEGMNRAAERAAGEAVDVFRGAIRQMTVADAFSILNGPEDAATEYFRGRTSTTLQTRFEPIVSGAMDEVGVARVYADALELYDRIPLGEKPQPVNLQDYVTARALDGLFTTLAREEAKIRRDPLARTTDLLRRVFGQADGAGS